MLSKYQSRERLLELEGLKEGLQLNRLSLSIFGLKVNNLNLEEINALVEIIEEGDYYV